MSEILLDNVLPKNATEYERVMALQVERLLDLDTERLHHLWDPWNCDIDDLPYLAWAMSVDIWDTNWPASKKRSAVANALKHHRLKGTLAGIEAYLGLRDTPIVKVVTPDAKLFSGPSLTKPQREAWLSKLPQVRIYRPYSRGTPGLRLFCGGGIQPRFREHRFPQPSSAAERLKPRATWNVKGVDTGSRVEVVDTNAYQVLIKAPGDNRVYSNAGAKRLKQRFYRPSAAARRIVTVAPLSTSPWRTAVAPNLVPVNSEPELVMQRHTATRGVITGTRPSAAKRFLTPSRANRYLYQRYPVDDGSVPAKRPSFRFTGVGRYGYPAHQAELTLKIRSPLDLRKARLGSPHRAKRFYLPHNTKPMDQVREAVVAAKKISDRVLVRADTTPGLIAGLPFLAGDTYLA